MEHSDHKNYGENIYMSNGRHVTGDMPVNAWYDEIEDYSFEDSVFKPNTGHFTQVVWKNSKELGVGIARKGHLTYVVTSYSPRGNYRKQFRENVPPRIDYIAPVSISKRNEELPSTTVTPLGLSNAPRNSIPRRFKEITTADRKFHMECLKAHNLVREIHRVKPLILTEELTQYATQWAQKIADSDQLKHSGNKDFGENIYRSEGVHIKGATPVMVWYETEENYDYDVAKFRADSAAFTQIVWKDTKELGVGVVRKDDVTIVVVSYFPPGNVRGAFMSNVLPKIPPPKVVPVPKVEEKKEVPAPVVPKVEVPPPVRTEVVQHVAMKVEPSHMEEKKYVSAPVVPKVEVPQPVRMEEVPHEFKKVEPPKVEEKKEVPAHVIPKVEHPVRMEEVPHVYKKVEPPKLEEKKEVPAPVVPKVEVPQPVRMEVVPHVAKRVEPPQVEEKKEIPAPFVPKFEHPVRKEEVSQVSKKVEPPKLEEKKEVPAPVLPKVEVPKPVRMEEVPHVSKKVETPKVEEKKEIPAPFVPKVEHPVRKEEVPHVSKKVEPPQVEEKKAVPAPTVKKVMAPPPARMEVVPHVAMKTEPPQAEAEVQTVNQSTQVAIKKERESKGTQASYPICNCPPKKKFKLFNCCS